MANDPTLTMQRRTVVSDAERERLISAGGLAIDARRTRARYFDGRFLAARDLTNDQLYAHTRQADLARSAGWGVVSGLEVRSGTRATDVVIAAGLGTTPVGETIALPSEVEVDLLQLRRAELLDAHLGLRRARTAASRARTGAFVLALRPIEYTANPRQAYPTSVDGQRRVEDHDIVEAIAVTLVPWPGSLNGGPDDIRRALVREIFLLQNGQGLQADLLPIAIVYLDSVAVRWIDIELVRRSIGAEQGDALGLGIASRAVRAAQVRQYNTHLHDVMSQTGASTLVASEHFEVLPPVGQMPAGAIDRIALSQQFFPPAVDVDISLAPEDELPLLIEESLLLPSIDLHAGDDVLSAASVLVLVPVTRDLFRRFKAALSTVRRPLQSRIGRVPVMRTPLLALGRLRIPGLPMPVTTLASAESAAWTNVLDRSIGTLTSDALLWFVRRRNFNYRAEIEGAVVDIDVTPE